MSRATIRRFVCRVTSAFLFLNLGIGSAAVAQNVVQNADFSAGEEHWNVTDIGGEFFAEVQFTDDPALCPTIHAVPPSQHE